MMTPLELEKLEFAKRFGKGYSVQEVDDAFAMIRRDYENLYKENIDYKDKINVLEELVSKYKAMEETMRNSIILAQQTGEAAITTAREQADLIVKEARDKAEAIQKENEAKQKALLAESVNIKKDISVFAAKSISLLHAQIEILDKLK